MLGCFSLGKSVSEEAYTKPLFPKLLYEILVGLLRGLYLVGLG